MLRTITTLIQLLAFTEVVVAVDNMAQIEKIRGKHQKIMDKIFKLKIYPDERVVKDIDAAKKYTRNSLGPAFSKCKNNFKSLDLNSKYKYVEEVFKTALDADKIIAMVNKDSRDESDYSKSYKMYAPLIGSIEECVKILLENKAIPSVKVNGKPVVSLNAMYKYFLYSLYDILGESRFNESDVIKKLSKSIKEFKDKLNEILKKFYVNGKFVAKSTKLDHSNSIEKISSMYVGIMDIMKQFLTNTQLDGDIDAVKEKKYLTTLICLKIIEKMFVLYMNYIFFLCKSENQDDNHQFFFDFRRI